ncbi:MAG: hypothetical protein NC311_08975 [Muribaculaceae bacterium]|nr:hypothetical protein [Muribaculaceae bacterium]
MAHEAQDRYSQLVDLKLRHTLVTKDNLIFNTRYEGDPKAGMVKIPVRDTEVEVRSYDKVAGISLGTSKTTYMDLPINVDEAVNDLIDGFDETSVPDGIVAERLDSAGYSMSLSMDKRSLGAIQAAEGANISATKTACTDKTAYKEALAAKRTLGRAGVPADGRWMIASPEYLEVLLQDDKFIKQGDLSQELVQAGAVGKIAGFVVFESNNMDFESLTRVEGKKVTTEFICGHPNWCHRVQEWQVPVHLQDLSGSGTHIGASAVQGRKVYGIKVSKGHTLYIKRIETAAPAQSVETEQSGS